MNSQQIIIAQLNSLNSKIAFLVNKECATGEDMTKEIRVIDKQIEALHKKLVKLMKVK